jgi:hypothetical protein
MIYIPKVWFTYSKVDEGGYIHTDRPQGDLINLIISLKMG